MARVLIVEDERVIRELLDDFLTDEGFDTLLAEDGARAVELARREMPDLVLIDLMLPILDGWAAIACLRDDPGTRGIPIVAMSANRNLLHVGVDADETIPKPFDLDRLLQIVAVHSAPSWEARAS